LVKYRQIGSPRLFKMPISVKMIFEFFRQTFSICRTVPNLTLISALFSIGTTMKKKIYSETEKVKASICAYIYVNILKLDIIIKDVFISFNVPIYDYLNQYNFKKKY